MILKTNQKKQNQESQEFIWSKYLEQKMKRKKEVEKDTKKRGFNLEKDLIIFSLIIFLLILIFILYLMIVAAKNNSGKILTCGDGTLYDSCSLRKPYYCSDGLLVEKASLCECQDILKRNGDLCTSEYQTNPKSISLKYILRGEENEIDFTVYKGMSDYLLNTSRIITYTGNKTPSRADFKLRNINEPNQGEFLLPLVTEIQNIAKDKNDQVRIAVSIVQNIPFGSSNKTTKFLSTEINYSRYPYEVLYDEEGVCGEKSELLLFLLREMGYEIVAFYYLLENHEAVGIKCPDKYGVKDSGYCFIETTGPAIISDSEIEYGVWGKLISEPEIMVISEGFSLGENLYEYDDAEDWIGLREKGVNTFSRNKFDELKEKYGLGGYYDI